MKAFLRWEGEKGGEKKKKSIWAKRIGTLATI